MIVDSCTIITSVKKKDDEKEKAPRRKIQPYSTTRIKPRNFLSNISYTGVKEQNLYDRNFLFDVYVLVTKKHESVFS